MPDLKRVPERIREIQTCYFWYHGCEPDAELRSVTREDQMLVVSCPEGCPKVIEGFNRAGGVVLLYISIYKAPVMGQVPDDMRRWEGGSPFRSSAARNPFWRAVDLTGRPGWMLRDERGQPRRPFEAPYYLAGWYQTTPLVEEYRRAACEGVTAVARDGRFNGVFLDNVHPNDRPSTVQREGELGRADMEAHQRAFYELIEAIRRTGDAASRGYFWLQTNGSHPEAVQRVADAMLFESFIYSYAWLEQRMSDEEAVTMLESMGVLRERGGRPVVLPYLGFSGGDVVADARRIRWIADRANAIYADFYTLVRPEIMGPCARRLVASQRPEHASYYPEARAALSNLRPGNFEAAREIYRLAPRAGQA